MSNKKSIILLTVVFIIFSAIFWGKTGNVLIDFSRESYIPYQMLNQKVLIKDIFLIYGAFGYIINSILYKIILNINILIALAHLISYFIVILFYFILRKFESNRITLVFSIFFIALSIFSHSTFGFALPYSYSTLWAIFGIYALLYSILYDKKKLLFLSLGLILTNKIEFFIPAIIVSLSYLIYRKEKFKKEALLILIFPLITTIYFLYSKIELSDILKNYSYIKTMLNTNSLEYLYKGMGGFFEISYFKYNLIKLAIFLLICTLSYVLYKFKPILSYIALVIVLLFLNTNESLNLAGIALVVISTILFIKNKLSQNEILLVLFSIILCSKGFFAINTLSYSNFGYFILVFSLFIILKKIINPIWLNFAICCFFTLNYIGNLGYILLNPKDKIKTDIGSIWIDGYDIQMFKDVNNYIKENIKKNEDFIVAPEGQIFNLIHKKDFNCYNSTFTPLDFETFGEKTIIKNLQENNPQYIILFPRDTSDYGANIICIDYGIDFCGFIMDNYTKTDSKGENYKAYIFKRKQ